MEERELKNISRWEYIVYTIHNNTPRVERKTFTNKLYTMHNTHRHGTYKPEALKQQVKLKQRKRD